MLIPVPCLSEEAMAILAFLAEDALRRLTEWQLVLLSGLYDGYCREYGCNCAIDVPADDELVAKGAAAYALTELL